MVSPIIDKKIQNRIGIICALLVKQTDAWTAPIPGKLVFSRDNLGCGMLDGQINVSL